jgi:hypothetical protein
MRAARPAVVTLMLVVLFTCAGIVDPSPVGALLFGWLRYARQSLPRVRYDWPRIGSAAVWLALFAGGLHLFCRWFYRERTGGARWRVRWTAIGVGLVIVMFATGTAAVGIVHQFMFLRTGPKVYDYPRYRWEAREPEQALGMCQDLLDRARARGLPAAQILRADVEVSTTFGYPHAHYDLAGIDGPGGVIETLIMYPRDPEQLARSGVFVARDGTSWIEKDRTPREVFAKLSRGAATRPTTPTSRPR